MTIVGTNPDAVIGGVDTHVDVHVAAAVNHVGGVLGVEAFPTTRAGYRQLVSWLRSHGELTLVGVEGTGSHGVGLARYLARAGVAVVEVAGRPGTGKVNRIRWMRWLLLEPPYQARPPGYRRPGTATSKRSGC